MATTQIFNGELARAARALVGVNALYVAREAGITRNELRDFEKGLHDLPDSTREQLREALQELGAVFLPDDETGGYGVRLKFSRNKARQIDRWEGEGGPAAEDDA